MMFRARALLLVAAGRSLAFAPTTHGGVDGAGPSVPPPLAASVDSSPVAVIIDAQRPSVWAIDS